MSSMLFVGEERSAKAIAMGVHWEDGALAAKQLFDALRFAGINPSDCSFTNLFEWGGKATVRRFNGLVVGMGRKVQRELTRMKVEHVKIVHPAARGSIRLKENYNQHVQGKLKDETKKETPQT